MAEEQPTQPELFGQGATCNRCDRPLLDAKFKLCAVCREELCAKTARRRAESKAAGRCQKCHRSPAAKGMRYCPACNEKENARSREKTRRAIEEGRCVACGKEPEDGKKKCTECLIKFVGGRSAWQAKAKAEDRCTTCGNPNDRLPRLTCSRCANRQKAKRVRLKLAAFAAYGGAKCACCGETIPDFLTIDHINNDGADHRRKVAREAGKYRRNGTGWIAPSNGQGVGIYAWLKRHKYPPGFQVLCMNCNFAKGRYGECPHKRANPHEPH